MNLNEIEMKVVQRARRECHRWRMIRTIGLYNGPILLPLACREFLQRQPDIEKALLWLLLGTWGLWYMASNWQGRPEAQLLLKLADDRKLRVTPAYEMPRPLTCNCAPSESGSAEQCAAADVRRRTRLERRR